MRPFDNRYAVGSTIPGSAAGMPTVRSFPPNVAARLDVLEIRRIRLFAESLTLLEEVRQHWPVFSVSNIGRALQWAAGLHRTCLSLPFDMQQSRP